jgi:hypothetical protein
VDFKANGMTKGVRHLHFLGGKYGVGFFCGLNNGVVLCVKLKAFVCGLLHNANDFFLSFCKLTLCNCQGCVACVAIVNKAKIQN